MKRLFLDLDGTLARFNVRNALGRFKKEKDFFTNLLAYKSIEVVNKLAKQGNLYIISASPNARADVDKLKWIMKYLPNIPIENITFSRLGENKAEIISYKYGITINSDCLLLDDYTKNLNDWENVGGTGIKRLTTCADNSRKLWKGAEIKDLKELAEVLA